MSTKVYLIRHGEVEYERDQFGRKLVYGPGVALSEEGRAQASKLGQRLREDGVYLDTCYTSPLLRARETAALILQAMGLPIMSEDSLIEEFRDVESGWGGRTMDELLAIGGDTYGKNGATLQQLSDRVTKKFRELLENHRGQTIGIVGHGDGTRVLYHHLTHQDDSLPDSATMRDKFYIGKGQAWELSFDDDLKLTSAEIIDGERSINHPERKF